MYQRILLAYDGTESGQKALLGCHEIAQWSQAELDLIAVMPSPAVYIAVDGGFYDSGRDEEDKLRFKAILEDGLRRLKEAGHVAKGEVLVGDVRPGDHRVREEDRRRPNRRRHSTSKGWAARWWRGSTSASLIEHSSCNVLVVMHADRGAPAAEGHASALSATAFGRSGLLPRDAEDAELVAVHVAEVAAVEAVAARTGRPSSLPPSARALRVDAIDLFGRVDDEGDHRAVAHRGGLPSNGVSTPRLGLSQETCTSARAAVRAVAWRAYSASRAS